MKVFKFILEYITTVIIIVVLPFVLWIIFIKVLPRTFYAEPTKVVEIQIKMYVETAEGRRLSFENNANQKWKKDDCASINVSKIGSGNKIIS